MILENQGVRVATRDIRVKKGPYNYMLSIAIS